MNPEPFVVGLSVFGIVGAVIAPIVMIGRWILGPIDRAAKFREAPVRFSIGDFLCLFLAVQIPLAAVYHFVRESEGNLFWLFTIITWVIAPFIWFACARALSKAGVINSKHRFVFMGLIMPIVYYGLAPFVLLSVAGGVALVTREPNPLVPSVLLIIAWVGLAGIFFLSGVFTKWMLRQSSSDDYAASDRKCELALTTAALRAAPVPRRPITESSEE